MVLLLDTGANNSTSIQIYSAYDKHIMLNLTFMLNLTLTGNRAIA